jgi:hypothetical protein
MLGCDGVELEVVLVTGADLINVNIFVCPVYCVFLMLMLLCMGLPSPMKELG